MTVDTEARRLAALTRQVTARTFDVEAGLASLRGAAVRRQRLRMTGLLVALATLVLAISLVVHDPATSGPAPAGTPSQHRSPGDASQRSGEPGCVAPRAVRCLGPTRFAVDTDGLSYVVDVPTGFTTQLSLEASPYAIDVYQDATDTRAGVSILLGVEAAGPGQGRLDAGELAAWVRSRPFLEVSEPQRDTVSGLLGWRVETRWAAGVEQPRVGASCNGIQPECRPVLTHQRPDRSWETGVWESMVGSYSFIDLPNGQVVALWSWAFDSDIEALAANDNLIQSLTLEAR